MPFIEPTSVFFSSLDASLAVFHLQAGDREVRVYFDEAFLDSDLGETKMDTNSPRLTCSHAEVRDVPRDCLVTVTTKAGPRDFIVLQVQPDGTGFALVTLTHDE